MENKFAENDPSSIVSLGNAVVAIPSVRDFYFTKHRFSSLGAHILTNVLIKNRLPTTFFNFPLRSQKSKVLDLPKDIAYLRDHIISNETGKLSYFTHFQRFGPSPEECAQLICIEKPDICFISSFAFSYSYEAILLAQQIKQISPKISIVLGGGGPSAYPRYFMKEPAIDFVLAGEAEISIKQFIDAFYYKSIDYKDVPNLFYKKFSTNFVGNSFKIKTIPSSPETLTYQNDVVIAHPESLHFSNSDCIDLIISKAYETKKSMGFATSLTRGCSKKCKFCSNFITHGNTFRKVPLDKVEKEISRFSSIENPLKKQICLNFEDDNLLLDTEYFLNVLKSLRKINPEMIFFAENGLDYALLTPELVNALFDLGLVKFNLALASINHQILESESRGLFLEHYKKIVETIALRKIPCITYFICGFKNDTKDTIAQTLAFLATQPTTIGISLFYPVPGIHGFENFTIFDKIHPLCCSGSSAYPWNNSLSTSSVITAFRLSRYINLLKQKDHSLLESEIIQKIQEKKKLFTMVKTKTGMDIIEVKDCDCELVEMTLGLLKR